MTRIDFHCHPSIKPLGKSFNFTPSGVSSKDLNCANSLFFCRKPTAVERFLNRVVMGLTKFTQSDFTALLKGNFSVVVVALSPLEKPFIQNRAGNNLIANLLSDFVTGVGLKRLEFIQSDRYRYFPDLQLDYRFYQQLDGYEMSIEGKRVRFKLVNSYSQINAAVALPDVYTIFVFLSIEGGHAFNSNVYSKVESQDILKNVSEVKKWEYAPVFITLAHHFRNYLTGHAPSLTGVIDWMTEQELDMNGELHPLGREVIKLMLDESFGQSRVLIDMKHMSAIARRQYREILAVDYAGEEIPLIVSHGAMNGLVDSVSRVCSPIAGASDLYNGDINFFDDEVIAIAKSKGVFGIQLDERRVASKSRLKRSNLVFASRHKRLLSKSKLVWEQILYIARVLDKESLAAWDVQVLGSDFDGIIDPISLFWTAEDIADLERYLTIHASDFLAREGNSLKSFNRITGEDIVAKFIWRNAEVFLKSLKGRG